jgi:hypothetical protein
MAKRPLSHLVSNTQQTDDCNVLQYFPLTGQEKTHDNTDLCRIEFQ